MSTIKTQVLLQIDYVHFVLDSDAAFRVFEALSSGSCYRKSTDWVKDEEGNGSAVSKLTKATGMVQLHSIVEEDFAIWRLAGESDK